MPTRAFPGDDFHTAEQTGKDLAYLQRLLEEIHPNLYEYRSRRELQRIWREIQGSVSGPQERWQVINLVQRMLASVCDEHTKVHLGAEFKKISTSEAIYLGHNLVSTKSRLYLDDEESGYRGRDLAEIGGRTSAEIRNFLEGIVSTDGCIRDGTVFTRQHDDAIALHLSQFLGHPTQYDFRFQKPDNTVVMPGMRRRKLFARSNKNDFRQRASQLKPVGIGWTALDYLRTDLKNGFGIAAGQSADRAYAYIYMQGFEDSSLQTDELYRIMRKLIHDKPKHVILDLTDSPGGYIPQAQRLVSYFLPRSHKIYSSYYRKSLAYVPDDTYSLLEGVNAKLRKTDLKNFQKNARRQKGRYVFKLLPKSLGNPDYKGKLTILVSPKTKSAAILAAIALQRERKTAVVGFRGEGVLGSSCFRADGIVTLPVTRVKLRIAESCYDRFAARPSGTDHLTIDYPIDPLAQPFRKMNQTILKAGVEQVLRQTPKAD
ncbi:MAG: S41 family peptidase [Rhizobiaceae bacterium]